MPLKDDEGMVTQFWAVAEELWDQRLPMAAIATLEGLLRRPIPASLVVEDVKTRLRLADMILSESVHPEWARRTLEPARDLSHHHAVGPALRMELLRLLSVCARRKHQHKLSVSYLEESLKSIGDERKRRTTLPLDLVHAEANAYLELSRTCYAKLLDSKFLDTDAAHQLVRVSSVYDRFALQSDTSTTAITLCVCHIYGLLCSSRFQDVSSHIQQAVALFGAMPELSVLKGLIDFSLLEGGPGALALGSDRGRTGEGASANVPSSPLRKRVRSESGSPAPSDSMHGDEPRGVMWLSEGALFAHDQLVELLKTVSKIGSSTSSSTASSHTSTVTPLVVERSFTTLMTSVDDQMKRLMNAKGHPPSSGSTQVPPAAPNSSASVYQSELRFLIAIKFCALSEVAALELTQLNLTAAVVKIDALRHFLELFCKHAQHFAHHVHLLCGVLFSSVAIAAMEDDIEGPNVRQAQRHFDAAAEAASDSQATIFVDMLRCAMWWNVAYPLRRRHGTDSPAGEGRPSTTSSTAYVKRNKLLEAFNHTLDALKENYNDHGNAQWTPRLRASVLLLSGCQSLEMFDYASAVNHFKSAAEISRKAMGMATPLLSLSLRLLAVAHHHSGVADASDVAMTTATQLSNRNHDESNLVHCLEWTLSRMLIGCDADIKYREQLLRSLESSSEHVKVQLAHVVSMDETERLRQFGAGRALGMGTPQSTGDSTVGAS